MHVADGAQVTEFSVVDLDVKDIFGEGGELHEREGIEAEVGGEAQVRAGRDEARTDSGIGEAGEQTRDDEGKMGGVAGAPEGEHGVERRGRTPTERETERGDIGGGGGRE